MDHTRRQPRVASNGYNPNTYVSIQERVNTNPDYREKYFSKMGREGWYKLEDKTDILKLPSNTQIKYIIAPHKRINPKDFGFRSGGFYQAPGENRKFITFKGFNKTIYTLHFADIENLYVKQISEET
jgi:hypothetical protein